MMSRYDGPERRGGYSSECEDFDTWRSAAASFQSRLDEIERLTKLMHDNLMIHNGQEDKTQQAILDLLETWHGAQFTVRLVKWLAPMLAAVAAAAMWAKDHIKL